mgnify:CR=1 FL=1
MSLSSIELFAGAGGLAMGATLAGFKSEGVVEWDRWACDTIRQNQMRGSPVVADWPLFEGDVREWIKTVDVGSVAKELEKKFKHEIHRIKVQR